jgi:glycosyltransferase involved in cell wall biosynthesis
MPERRKIALTTCNLPSKGGVFNYIEQFIRKINKDKYQIYLIYYSADPDVNFSYHRNYSDDVKIIFSPLLWTKQYLFIPAVFYLTQLYRTIKPDIVYSIFSYTDLVATWAAKLAGVNKIVSGIRGILVAESNPPWEQAVYNVTYPPTARWIHRFIAVSDSVKQEAVAAFGMSPEKITVIRNGVDLQEFDTIRGDPQGLNKVSFCGRLQYEKGADVFIRSIPAVLQSCPAVTFEILGDGPDRRSLEDLACQLGIADAIEFLGWRQDARQLMASHSIVVLPSLREGMPWTALEAMALRKPVVASRVGGIPEVVIDGHTGFLVEPGDPQAIAAKIIYLLSEPVLRAEMGTAGRKRIENHFSIDDLIGKTERVFDEVLSGG